MVVTVGSGDWCFITIHTNVQGDSSVDSNMVSRTVSPSGPQPPQNLIVAGLNVFAIVYQTDQFLLVVVGSVPAGTPCDETETVNGHYAVPRDQVTWSSDVQPLVVVANCA